MKSSWMLCVLISISLSRVGELHLHGADAPALPVVDLKINHVDARLSVDTGSEVPILIIGRSSVEKLRLGIEPPPASANEPLGRGVAMAVARDVPVAMVGEEFSINVNAIENPYSVPLDGCVGSAGWPLFKSRIRSLRLGTRRIDLLSEPPQDAAGWARLKLVPDATVLLVYARTGDHDSQVLLDTGGSFGVAVPPPDFADLLNGDAGAIYTLDAGYSPLAGLYVSRVLVLRTFHLGEVELHYVRVQEGPSVFLPKGRIAVVGRDALSQCDVVIDSASGTAFIHALDERPSDVTYNRLGAVFVPKGPGDSNLCAVVAPKTPAARAGIEDGDILLSIDGRDVTQWRTHPEILPFSRFWDQPAGTNLRLMLRGRNGLKTVHVSLEDIFKL